MPHYAHSRKGAEPDTWELLPDHLEAAARRASVFAEPLRAALWGRALGLLHDVGKATPEFFARLNGAPERVDHSTAGAKLAVERWPKLGRLLAYALAGHHAGLPDSGELTRRLADTSLPVHDPDAVPVLPELEPLGETTPFGKSMRVRMLFSCLTDADWLSTEAFYQPDTEQQRQWEPFDPDALLARLDRKLAGFKPDTEVREIRAQVLARCRAKAAEPPGFFTLTVPTGGGKTLSSLAFALEHARIPKHKMRRVVYVIPYTSIIEQTAQVFREAVGQKNVVLEHHSNFRHPKDDGVTETDDRTKLKLAEENWDAPVVVTTNVQFFESLFANRATRVRKLHNLANAVIVLDEAQLLPVPFLAPCLEALKCLVRDYGCTVVLCTATQPALSDPKWLPKYAIENPTPIIDDPNELHCRLHRVEMTFVGTKSDEQVAETLKDSPQAMVVVNTRNHARALFQTIKDQPGAVHLSARMCPAHRRVVLDKIRKDLKAGLPCRLVSTQLVEAGVDVSFPLVLRALAGLDSLIQTAGRCNREREIEKGKVLVFEPEGGTPSYLGKHATWALDALSQKDPMSPDAVRAYFQNLYDSQKLDGRDILPLLTKGAGSNAFEFRTAAGKFRLIEDKGMDVVVPWNDEASHLVAELDGSEKPQRFLRPLQNFTVRIPVGEFKTLERSKQVRLVGERFWVLKDGVYDEAMGLQPG